MKNTRNENIKKNIVSPDNLRDSALSRSLAKKLKSSVNKKNPSQKKKSKLKTLKSTSSNIGQEKLASKESALKKTRTSSPGKLLGSMSNKKQSSTRHLGKKQGISDLLGKKRKSGSNTTNKNVLRDSMKSLHNSQNLKKNPSQHKGQSQEKTSTAGISRFNNYLANKSTMMNEKEPRQVQENACENVLFGHSFHTLCGKTLRPLYEPFLLSLLERHREALDGFFRLPQQYCNDPWVLACIGKCYTELTFHKKADLYFARAFKPLPCPFPSFEDSEVQDLTKEDKIFLSKSTPDRVFSRIENIEFYSSCLWHLKKQQELCLLAHHCLENHFFCPETWIVLANTYSLNQDHETALQFLARALKIDPDNAYAFCLSGHEHACKENFEQAGHCYKNAINIDPRNVRAYWGLGNLSLKMEKFDTAIDYFMKALKINGKCSTFYTQIGIAFLNKNNLELALSYMKRGEDINPEDPFNRYNKAYVRVTRYCLSCASSKRP